MIDELDRRLIQELQKNGRQGYVNLAKMLGVAEGTVRKRVKNLRSRNIVKIAAMPNPRALGYNFLSFMGLQVRMAELTKVAEELVQRPNVCYLAFVTGKYDLMAIIITQSPEELPRFLLEEISSLPGILRTETFINLDVLKGGWLGMDTTQLIDNLSVTPSKKDRRTR